MNRTILVTLCKIGYLLIQDPVDAIPQHLFCNLLTWYYSVLSRPFSCVGVCTVVLHIHRRIILATLMHCVAGTSLIHGHACIGTQSNTQEVTSAHLSHSGATYLLYETDCTLIVACRIFRTDFCPLVMYILMKSLTITNKTQWCLCGGGGKVTWEKLITAAVESQYNAIKTMICFIQNNEYKIWGSI